ncbi:hypothetical protein RB597_010339 [Gaeumannomyces tritici]
MRPSTFLAIAPIAASLTNAQQKLPNNVQFDLLFPQPNETYAPTQYFPIVFGIQNADGVLPILPKDGLSVIIEVWADDYRRNSSVSGWGHVSERFNSNDFKRAPFPSSAAHFIHYPPINMTNGTTKSYYVNWHVVADNKCNPQNGDLGNDTWSHWNFIRFNTAPGAQLPDIAASIDSCPEPHNSTSITLDVKPGEPNDRCPTFHTTPSTIKCGYKPLAKDLAANVSAAMLGKMGCDEGDWRTISTPCPPKAKQSGGPWAAATTGAVWAAWVLAMVMAF